MAEQDRSIEAKVFHDNYDKLVSALPLRELIPKFISRRIITFKDQDRILAGETDLDKRERFLKHIAQQLETDHTDSFYKFLEIVEKYGGSYSYLAKDIQNSLEEGSVTVTAQPCQDTGYDENAPVPLLPSNSMTLMSPPDENNVTSPNEAVHCVNNEQGKLTNPPTLSDLIEHVGSCCSTKWYNLGLRLGVITHTLDQIEEDCQRKTSEACRKMFQECMVERETWWNLE
ncbi:uncharacterized protein [Dysidea avara]|uniref:uncharacterized protein isoform X2 n=1 Tax=Dysidea avara TaxID=196820 RepID=UPI00331C5C2A